MTNKDQALHDFWAGFGLTAYDENTVPENAEMPRLTYNVVLASFNEPQAMTASLWYRTRSWEEISDKAAQIAREIGRGGKIVHYDGGAVWIKRGSPFSQRVSDEDDTIRRILINIEAEFLSAD